MNSKEITRDIIESILSKELPKDTKLPSESDLSEKYSCNRHTIRKVIEYLIERGYLRKTYGGSTYVNDSPSKHSLSLRSLYDSYAATNIKTEVLKFTKQTASPLVADKLKIAPKDKVWCITRIRYIMNKIDHIEYVYMPVALFPDLTFKNCESSLLYYIEVEMGFEISHGIKTISAVQLDDYELIAFRLNESRLALQIENIGYLTSGRIYEFSISKDLNNNITYYAKR